MKHYFFLIFLFLAQFAYGNAATETILPLNFDTGNSAPYGFPSTIIKIQGKDIPILFDTGAKKHMLALTPKAIRNLDVKYTGEKMCYTGIDKQYCGEVFIIPEVQIGSFAVKQVKGVVMEKLWGGNDEGFKPTAASENGIMGFALLSKFNILLDYAHGKAILTELGMHPVDYDIAQWTVIPFVGHFQTSLIIDGKPMVAVWDTGAIPSTIKKSLAKDFKLTDCPTEAPYKNNCKGIITTSMKTSDQHILPNTWFMSIDQPDNAPFDVLIGSNFYEKNLVFFDMNQHKIYVKSY